MIQKQGNTEAVPVGERERQLLFFLTTVYHNTYSKSINLIFNVKSKIEKAHQSKSSGNFPTQCTRMNVDHLKWFFTPFMLRYGL
jgi:hypothetical protein